ncbi:MAG: hypothetical protein KBI46_00895 [Phycisphaerae bacterium]|nr:hypothetical protein [Phycisphaerae bacterium]
MELAIIVIGILLTMAYFYLKCTPMSSLSTLLASIFALIIAFSWYEKITELFISRGYGVDWAHFGCFLLSFILTFALLRALADLLVGVNIDLGKPVKLITALVCGFLTGIILTGTLLVALGMLPLQGKVFYSRFDPSKPVSLNSPKVPLLNADGFVVGLYRLVSAGSMSSGKSFGVVHADFLKQIHLNRLRVQEGVLTVSSRKALILPSGKNQKPVREWDIPNRGKLTVVRMGIVARNIADGGANNSSGQIQFFPGQIRMICKPSGTDTKKMLAGSGKAIWPVGFIEGGKLVEKHLEEIITPETKGLKDRTIWLDAAFDVPQGQEGVLLQFKQYAMVQLPKAVSTSDEVEKALLEGSAEANAESSPTE